MAARQVLTTTPARAVSVLVALLVSSSIGATAGSLVAQAPEADGARAAIPEAALDGHEEPAADRPDRPVLTNAGDLARLMRRWYRALDVGGRLGEGSVTLLLRVQPDGSVSDSRVLRSGPHHPALNALARRAGGEMVFSFDESGSAAGADGRARWVRQRIDFVR